jgi:AcrR family transcriptional regulator
MVSSAVYRYYPSRDELLTALIIEAYQAVGEAAELAEATVRRADHQGRWLALTGGVRSWAAGHPQEYALIFGSPVPGYQAPRDTVDPAGRIPLLIMAILHDAVRAGRPVPPADRPMPRSVRADLKALRGLLASDLPEHQVGRAVLAWTQLIGSISFELFGHLVGAIVDYDSYFDYQMGLLGHQLGLDLRAG